MNKLNIQVLVNFLKEFLEHFRKYGEMSYLISLRAL